MIQSKPNRSPESSQDCARRRSRSIEDFCTTLLSLARVDLKVTVEAQDHDVTVDLAGADRPLLLANAASLLNSLEYLTNKAFRTGKGAPIEVILFDSEHYRQHREAELTLLAKMASEKVISMRQPLSLQPMTPRERRIVHLVLAAIEGVRSESSGSGDHRSVTIYPAG